MFNFLNDLRFGFRQLRKSRAFAFTAILTLGLGIGANTAVFSVMNAVLLRSLPVSQPDRIFHLRVPTGQPSGATNTGDSETSFSYPEYEALRQRRDTFSDLIASVPLAIGKTGIRYGAQPEFASGEMVSGNFFSSLGVPMARGRGFSDEDEAKHSSVAVLSYAFWTRRFNRNPDVIGQTLYVKGVPFSIIGVSTAGFAGLQRGIGDTDFWIPLQNRADLNAWGESGKTFYERPEWWCLLLSARLPPGMTATAAATQVQPLFQTTAYAQIGQPKPGTPGVRLTLVPAKGFDQYADAYTQPLYLLMGLVGLVLFIACTNVALLLVARNQQRQREFSLRLAIGAGRWDLFRQLLTESLLLVLAGGALAWLLAIPATSALAAWSQIDSSLAPDRNVLLFTLGTLVLAAVAFGLAPLFSALAVATGPALKTTGPSVTQDKKKSRFGVSVVAFQMALCIVLLVAAGLLLRTLHNLENVPLGIRTQGLLVFGIDPQGVRNTEQTIQFYQALVDRLRVLPSVESVALVEQRPGYGWSSNNIAVVDGVNPKATNRSFPPLRSNAVGADFFHVMGIPVLLGRGITEADTAASPRVAVVNQTFVDRYLPNQNPLGHRVGGKEYERTIVGVVQNNKYTGLAEQDIPMMWTPYTQAPEGGVSEMNVEMRVQGDPLAVVPEAERAVREVDPNLPLLQPTTQQAQFEQSISDRRLFARLAVFFGLIAGLLVATGLYGTLAYRVSHRSVEIGVRLALGAQRRQVLGMVLRESLVIAAIGTAVGLPLAVTVSRLLRSMLFGIGPNDVLTFAGALLMLVAIILAASLIPASRAAGIDPMQALRTE